MINPGQFARSGDEIWAAALRVAAIEVDLGRGRVVEFLGQITPRANEDGTYTIFFRMLNNATGERYYMAPTGETRVTK